MQGVVRLRSSPRKGRPAPGSLPSPIAPTHWQAERPNGLASLPPENSAATSPAKPRSSSTLSRANAILRGPAAATKVLVRRGHETQRRARDSRPPAREGPSGCARSRASGAGRTDHASPSTSRPVFVTHDGIELVGETAAHVAVCRSSCAAEGGRPPRPDRKVGTDRNRLPHQLTFFARVDPHGPLQFGELEDRASGRPSRAAHLRQRRRQDARTLRWRSTLTSRCAPTCGGPPRALNMQTSEPRLGNALPRNLASAKPRRHGHAQHLAIMFPSAGCVLTTARNA